MPIRSVNPATGEVVESFEEFDPEALERALAGSRRAFEGQRDTPFAERAGRMNRAAGILEGERASWARIATEEMGKTLGSALAEIDKCAWVCRDYAEHAESLLAERIGRISAFFSIPRSILDIR